MKYRQIVIETRNVVVAYIVEANSLNEAVEKLENGETIEEHDLRNDEVINRTPYSPVTEVA